MSWDWVISDSYGGVGDPHELAVMVLCAMT